MAFSQHLKTKILAAFAVETLCVTYFLKIPGGTPFFSILYFIAGISISIFLLAAPDLRLPRLGWKRANRQLNVYRLVICCLLGLAMYNLCLLWFDEIPLDINYADMLPIIKVMGQRFAGGHSRQVYDLIPWIWTGVQPIYLPAMWLPFVPAVVMDIDLRWITVAGLLFSFSIFIFLYRPAPKSYRSFFLGVIAFLLFWWIFADDTPGVVTVSEEGVVIAYYVLLVLSLLSGNAFLIGIAASLCMLSRYALVGWIPAYVLFLFLNRKWKQSGIFILTGLACFVLLFLLPVGWTTFMRLAKLPADYVQFAAVVWEDSPHVFSTGSGLAWLFGPKRIALLHSLLIILSFLVPLAGMLYCYFRNKTKKMANIPIAILKITLVFFYSFIDVPYLYLFYTSSFVSLILITLMIQDGERVPDREMIREGDPVKEGELLRDAGEAVQPERFA